MECDSLIDFNSPLKKGNNMLDPLVPLPQTNNVQENIGASVVGDNPFDNMILQICKLDDPFEITEKKALKRNDDQLSQNQIVCQEKLTKEKLNIQKEETNNRLNTGTISKCSSPQCKLNSSFDALSPKVSNTPEKRQSTSLNEKSLSESYLSPAIGKLDKKFSKLYLSSQLDKQLLDESSTCIQSVDEDTSLLNASKLEKSFEKSLQSPSPMNIPKGKEEVKAFVANRIEKCIEKALNDSRSLNSSFRHRRSLSAASLYTGSALRLENPFNYSVLNPSLEPSSVASMYRNRSFSNHDLHSSLNTNMWGSQHNTLDIYTGETFSNATSRFNTAFRKSTATSSMYSSYGVCDVGFRKSTTSLSSYRPSNTSVANISSQVNGDESVFLNDDVVVMGGKSSSCVFMEAKNLSCILQRRATADDDEPLEADVNFLTDNNFQIELVDSDSSCSEYDGGERNSEQRKEKNKSEKGLNEGGNDHSKKQEIRSSSNVPPPLSCDKIAEMGLHFNSQSKKLCRPLLVPPPPVPLASASSTGNLVLKPKSQTESKVGKRGPMKAMIPVGNMMRQEAKKENVPSKQVTGRVQKGDLKLLPNNNLRKSISAGDKLQKEKSLPPSTSQPSSPALAVCGRPVACSTPDGVLPLVSPAVGLHVSHIAKETPVDCVRRRSKSAGTTASEGPVADSGFASTPTRKPTRHVRSKSGLAKSGLTKNGLDKSKPQSPDAISPGQMPVCTSTPLKSITKNSPSLNRMKKPSQVNRKLLQRDDTRVEKENLQPRVAEQKRPLWRSSTRRMEAN